MLFQIKAKLAIFFFFREIITETCIISYIGLYKTILNFAHWCMQGVIFFQSNMPNRCIYFLNPIQNSL